MNELQTGYRERPGRRFHGLFWVIASVSLSGCAETPPPALPPSAAGTHEPKSPAEVYFPLQHDTVYQYATQNRSGVPGLLVMQVQRDAQAATLTTAGKVQQVEIRADGIYNQEGFYLLRLPFEPGNRWRGKHGSIEITQVDSTVKVEAGHFEHCLTTTETGGAEHQRHTVVTTFCPNVGIVSLLVEAQTASGIDRERAELRYFGPRVDVDAL